MRKERYKLIGMLLFTILMLILGFIGFIRDSDYKFLFMTVILGTMPYGYCILSKRKKGKNTENYDEKNVLILYFKFLFKFSISFFIGIFVFVPVLLILISNVKKENEEFSKRRAYVTKKIDINEHMISGFEKDFSNKYLPILEKYPECIEDSKTVLSLVVELYQLLNKLYCIQLYEGNIFYSGLISTFIANTKLKNVYRQIEKFMIKIANYLKVMSEQDFMEEDDDCLCEWADELDYYTECIVKEVEETEWVVYKHHEMFSFFLKRDLIVFGIIGFFLLSFML